MPSAVIQKLADLEAWKEGKNVIRRDKKERRKRDLEQGDK
jgi:hypothetical protein